MAKINEEKRAQWATLIQEQEASGLSRQAFCKERDLNFSVSAYNPANVTAGLSGVR